MGADAQALFNANFVRRGARRKCIYVQDTESFVAKLHLFMKNDKIKEEEAGPVNAENPE